MSKHAQLEEARLQLEKKNRREAAILSGTLFFLVLALCFLLTAFTIQDPPPGEQFVAVGFADLGVTEEAGGETESETPSEEVQEAVKEVVASSVPDPVLEEATEEVVTQESSEMMVDSKPIPKPDPDPEFEPEPVREDRTAHLFRNSDNPSTGGGGSQGATQGTGNEGEEAGKIEGRGVVSGDVGEGLVGGGSMLGDPRLDEKPQEAGTVRIRIQVDAAGKVISASPVYESILTTLTDSYHVKLAQRAAMTARFEGNATQNRRLGYITITFDLE